VWRLAAKAARRRVDDEAAFLQDLQRPRRRVLVDLAPLGEVADRQGKPTVVAPIVDARNLQIDGALRRR